MSFDVSMPARVMFAGQAVLVHPLLLGLGAVFFVVAFYAETAGEPISRVRRILAPLILAGSAFATGVGLKNLFEGEPGVQLKYAAPGAVLGGLLVARWFSLRLAWLADFAARPATLGYALMKVGCLASGCCYGTPGEYWFHVRYDELVTARLPKVIVEHPEWRGLALFPLPLATILLCGIVLVFLSWKRPRFGTGRAFLTALAIFVVGRALLVPFDVVDVSPWFGILAAAALTLALVTPPRETA